MKIQVIMLFFPSFRIVSELKAKFVPRKHSYFCVLVLMKRELVEVRSRISAGNTTGSEIFWILKCSRKEGAERVKKKVHPLSILKLHVLSGPK